MGEWSTNSPPSPSCRRYLRPWVPDLLATLLIVTIFLFDTQCYSRQAVNGRQIAGHNNWTR